MTDSPVANSHSARASQGSERGRALPLGAGQGRGAVPWCGSPCRRSRAAGSVAPARAAAGPAAATAARRGSSPRPG
jgi:hypothetical protein